MEGPQHTQAKPLCTPGASPRGLMCVETWGGSAHLRNGYPNEPRESTRPEIDVSKVDSETTARFGWRTTSR